MSLSLDQHGILNIENHALLRVDAHFIFTKWVNKSRMPLSCNNSRKLKIQPRWSSNSGSQAYFSVVSSRMFLYILMKISLPHFFIRAPSRGQLFAYGLNTSHLTSTLPPLKWWTVVSLSLPSVLCSEQTFSISLCHDSYCIICQIVITLVSPRLPSPSSRFKSVHVPQV